MKQFIIGLLFICGPRFAMGCTDFRLEDQKGMIVVGRSMEFAVPLDSEIAIYPAGETINKNGFSWTIQYGFIGITAFSRDILSDGMNEAGLSFGALWFPSAKYPTPKKGSTPLPIEAFGEWILGNFKSVDDVRAALAKVQILAQTVPRIQSIPPLHFSIHDKTGKSLVVEFINGKMEITDNFVGVLTNAPKFSWHVTNLSNYIHLTSFNNPSIDLNGTVIGPIGQGSGLLGIPGDWTPPSRFIRIAAYKNLVQKAPNPRKNATLAFHLLNTVDIPYGAIRPANGEGLNYTQWVVVKDLKNNLLYYRTYDDLNQRKISLSEALKGNKKAQFLKLDH